MEYADFVEKCINEYKENENEFIYQLIDPFCETVVEKTLSKKELKEILLKGMRKSIPLDKIKQAIEKIQGKSFTEEIFDEDIFNSTNTESVSTETAKSESYIETEVVKLSDVLEILNRLIESED